MSRTRLRWLSVLVPAAVALVGWAVYVLALGIRVPEARELRAAVRAAPPVAVVFTSRTEPESLTAAAPESEGFHYPGTVPFAAREGRLRLLTTAGKVYELTWGRPLPGGGTLIDVMAPTITADGKRVLFAGRRAAPDAGRWRIYQVGVDGSDLRQLTGGPDDAGCVADPPLRYAADGSVMSPDDRRRLDYDDLDPCDDAAGGFFFASSRLPDLGRGHARRATQIWYRPAAGEPRTLSANRNNDRWPFYARGQAVLFSLWSRNREAVTADGAEVRPVSDGAAFATRPTDTWVGARVFPDGTQFGYAVKTPEPVWRPRPLFNGRVAFMTAAPGGGFRLAQADWGYLRFGGSSLSADTSLPGQRGGELVYGPDRDADGRPLSAGCPSPCPGGRVLFAAAPAGPASFGLYMASDDWAGTPAPQLLFDDPALVDADPVAVYRRELDRPSNDPPPATGEPPPGELRAVSGRPYRGPFGLLDNKHINAPMPDPFPGQDTDAGGGPVVPHPTGVRAVAFYAAHRDRFDDPARPRVPGGWEKLAVVPLSASGHLKAWLPADPLVPTVLAGLDETGAVARSTGATDGAGRAGAFYAVAGDHYSGTRPNGYHFCIGCHTGHTFITADIGERSK